MCIGCDELLTIKHILLTCSDLIEIRQSYFAAQSLHELFQEILLEKIFNFFLVNVKLEINFGYVCTILPFLSMILKLYTFKK